MSDGLSSLGLYIHVPFCDGKCNYCNFYSFVADEALIDKYTETLKSQILNWGKQLNNKIVDTVYFGGGTPSLLGDVRLTDIINTARKAFEFDPDCEITLEANPSSGKLIDFSELKRAGFNRVSLGMQTAIEDELKLLGRRHSKQDVINTINEIKKSGISNYSLDVMLGIPLQTIESLTETLEFCINLDSTHISTYMLTIEPDTVFGKKRENYIFADEDMQADLFKFTCEFLADEGYNHYEISNFCKENLRSKHNMRYWELKDYLGLGPSAHSLINGRRFYYPENIEKFCVGEYIDDGNGSTEEEYIMLSLRTSDGINIKEYEKRYLKSFSVDFYSKISLFEKAGYIKYDDNSIRLTENGFLVSNAIIAELI